jgi:hypothetical protein
LNDPSGSRDFFRTFDTSKTDVTVKVADGHERLETDAGEESQKEREAHESRHAYSARTR